LLRQAARQNQGTRIFAKEMLEDSRGISPRLIEFLKSFHRSVSNSLIENPWRLTLSSLPFR
jgi:hypothetical protein